MKPYKRIILDEGIRLSDLAKHAGISDLTRPWMKDRKRIFKKKSATLLQMKVNKEEDYVDFKFVSTPTYDPDTSKVTKEPSMNLVPGDEYDQTIRILDFFKSLETNPNIESYKDATLNDIKETIKQSEIKLWCDCPMFHWTGTNYNISLFDGSLHPTDIYPKHWVKYHKENNLVCKHLDLIFIDIARYTNNFSSMLLKYVKK